MIAKIKGQIHSEIFSSSRTYQVLLLRLLQIGYVEFEKHNNKKINSKMYKGNVEKYIYPATLILKKMRANDLLLKIII